MASRTDTSPRGEPQLTRHSLDSPESKSIPPPMDRSTSSSSRRSSHDHSPSSPRNQRPSTPRRGTREPEERQPSPAANEAGSPDVEEDANPVVDMETFGQILEMDDEEDHDFSWSIVVNYFEQAQSTIKKMGAALEAKNLADLSEYGHFLKGSSAALGVNKVKESCEQMQHYGKLRDEEKSVDITKEEALDRIGKLIPWLQGDYAEAEKWLKDHYKALDE